MVSPISEVDGGVNGESLLVSLSGAVLTPAACGFAADPKETPDRVYEKITAFQKALAVSLTRFLKNAPAPPLKALLDRIAKLK